MTAQSKIDSETFAFWRLPVLTRSLVTKFMDPVELISLSMHSPLFKRLLMAHKINCASLQFGSAITIRKRYDKTRGFKISLEFIGTSEDKTIKFVSPIDAQKKYPEKEKRLIDNKRMTVAREYSNQFVFGDLHGQWPAAVRMTRHLLEILQVENVRFDIINIPARVLFKNFIWDLVEKIDYFRFYGMDDWISHKQAIFLMNIMRIDELRLDVNVEDPEELYGIQIQNKKFFAMTGDWITMDNVLEATSEVIHVALEKMEPNELVELVENWKNGKKLANLKMLQIETRTDQSSAIEKIKKLRGVKKLPDNIWEIRRATDGQIAHFEYQYFGVQKQIMLNVVQID